MAEYIEREELQEIFENRMQDNNIMCPVIKVLDVIEIIEKAPAVDVAEVKHGQNLNRKYIAADEFRCSECGIHLEDWAKCIDEEDDVWGEYEFKFCPNCGAKMEGGDG